MWRVFTARYALSPYIKQISFAFRGLKRFVRRSPKDDSVCVIEIRTVLAVT
jgi:hypothetical protein